MSTDDRRSTSAKRRNVLQAEDTKPSDSARKAIQAIKKRKKNSIWDQYSYHIIIGGFILIIAVTLLTTLLGKTKKLHLTPVIENDEIEAHNHNNYGYKLGPNTFFQDQTLADAKKIFSNYFSYKQSLSRCTALDEGAAILEEHYDFREAYPQCVSPVVDQKNCSSSFAVASAGAISDRLCMATGQNVRLSAQQYLSCQEDNEGRECSGGDIAGYLDYAKRKGLVDENCFPYVGENNVPCDPSIEQCQKYFIQDYCVASGPEGIKKDILKNGPAIGYLPAYRDFLVYKSGIYAVPEGTSKFQGGHAVKIIGWGTHEGEQYWIIENSWGEDWGIKGYAHIAVGQEDLFLDQYAFSPNPRVEKAEEEPVRGKEQAEVINA